MNGYSSNRIKNFSVASGFYIVEKDYPSDALYLNKETELQSNLLDAEFESYSEVSVDTSSDSSQRYKIKSKKTRYIPPYCGEASAMQGSSDGDRLSPYELSEISINLPYSEDEMSDILPLDQTLIHRNRTMEEQVELRYLKELLQNASYYSEYDDRIAQHLCDYDPSITQDLYRNMEEAQEASSDFLPPDSLILNKLFEEDQLRSVIHNWGSSSLHQMLRYPAINQSFVNDTMQRNSPPRDSQKWEQKSPKWKQKPTPPSTLVSKKGNQAKPCSSVSDAEQRVFFGGLPVGMTERSLRQQLAVLGYKVLKRPKILRGFAPEVLMRSPQEAKELVERGTIMISGVEVEVRPFNSLMKQSESRKIPNIKKRSIFLGGLADGTTAKDIQDVLKKMGIRIVNYPSAKFGFSRQFILESACQAKTLIAMKKVLINGTLVDVRPFVRQQSRKKRL